MSTKWADSRGLSDDAQLLSSNREATVQRLKAGWRVQEEREMRYISAANVRKSAVQL